MLLAAEQAAQSLVAQLRRRRRDLTVMKAMSGGWSTAALAKADLPLEQVMRGWVLTCGRSEVMRGTAASAQLEAAGSERSASDSSNVGEAFHSTRPYMCYDRLGKFTTSVESGQREDHQGFLS